MRRLAAPALLLALAACASPGGPAHPPMAPAEAAGEDPNPGPPTEGTDFAVFRGDGTPATLQDVVEAAGRTRVVFFGEQHNDQMTHRLQSELLRRLFVTYNRPVEGSGPSVHPGRTGVDTPQTGRDRTVVLSLEMFERDVQYIVDEYLAGLITESHFLSSARPWDQYEDRYRPAVEFARAHGLPVVAANAPRRYVNRASRLGRDSIAALPATALRYLPPMPYPDGTAAYRAEWDALMGDAAGHMAGDPFDGQVLWDATMAYSVAQALEAHPEPLVLHFAGSFHVENFTGTPEALQHYKPGTPALVVVGVPAEDRSGLAQEHLGQGDFVILTREMQLR